MSEARLDRRWRMSLAAALVCAAALFAMLGIARTAAASYPIGYHQFCWGVQFKTGNETCDGLSHDGLAGYLSEVSGSGKQHSVCVTSRPITEPVQCSAGPLQGVYNKALNPKQLAWPFIQNNCYKCESPFNEVFGGAVFVKGPEEGGGGSTPPASWHFQSLSGEILGDPTISTPAEGSLDIFVQGLDNNLWHRWAVKGPWSEWQNLSELTGSGTIASSPGAVSWDSVRVDIVARMSNGTVGHWYYNGSWNYDNLGGSIVGDPDIASVGSNYLNVFARSTSGSLVQKWTTNGGSSWSEWQDLSAVTGSGAISSGVGAVTTSKSSKMIDVVARMPAGNVGVWHWSGSAWSFENLSGTILEDPDVSSTGGGAANVYVKGLDENLWQKWRVGSGWSEWQNVSELTGSGKIASGPGATSWGSGRVDVVGRKPDGTVGNWYYE